MTLKLNFQTSYTGLPKQSCKNCIGKDKYIDASGTVIKNDVKRTIDYQLYNIDVQGDTTQDAFSINEIQLDDFEFLAITEAS